VRASSRDRRIQGKEGLSSALRWLAQRCGGRRATMASNQLATPASSCGPPTLHYSITIRPWGTVGLSCSF